MDEAFQKRARTAAPWIGGGLLAVVAFGLGTCFGGDSAPAHDHDGITQEGQVWTCAMHPQIRQNEPGQGPICGMDLVPVSSAGDESAGPGRVSLSRNAAILARIRTEPVERAEGAAIERRLLGRVDYDETTLRTVTAWTSGRIDRLHVRVTGQKVRRGQVIATLYSPEVYSAQQDLIQAARQAARMLQGTDIARSTANVAVDAARQRLRLLGVPDREISRMQEAERPAEHVAIRTPYGGTIIERTATEGSYIQTGTGLYKVADLTKLWVQLDAYESDLAILRVGQTVALEVQAFPGSDFEGRVAFIDPVLNPRLRTARVRIEVRNQDGRLRPGMFAQALVRSALDEGAEPPLVIPATAPLFTGRRSVVYVEVPDMARPTYEARVVRLGSRMGQVYPVVSGLNQGDRVVVSGAFALDADLQIRGGSAMMTMPDDVERARDQPVETPVAFIAGLAPIARAYLGVQEKLASDDLAMAKAAAAALGTAVEAFTPSEPAPAVAAWEALSTHLSAHGQQIANASSIEDSRRAFEPLSQAMVRMLRVFGNPLNEPVRLAFCPMAAGSSGAEWVQRGEALQNSYFGADMLSCGEIRATIAPGANLPSNGDDDAGEAPSGDEHAGHTKAPTSPRGRPAASMAAPAVADEHAERAAAAHTQHTMRSPSGTTMATTMATTTTMRTTPPPSGQTATAPATMAPATMAPTTMAPATMAPVAEVWTCPMHRQIREGAPGRCPICNMHLRRASGGSN